MNIYVIYSFRGRALTTDKSESAEVPQNPKMVVTLYQKPAQWQPCLTSINFESCFSKWREFENKNSSVSEYYWQQLEWKVESFIYLNEVRSFLVLGPSLFGLRTVCSRAGMDLCTSQRLCKTVWFYKHLFIFTFQCALRLLDLKILGYWLLYWVYHLYAEWKTIVYSGEVKDCVLVRKRSPEAPSHHLPSETQEFFPTPEWNVRGKEWKSSNWYY